MNRLSPLALALIIALPATAQHRHGEGESHEKHAGGMTHDFSGIERWVERFENSEREAWQQPGRVVAALGLKRGDTVADVGAGTGYFVPHLSEAVGSSGTVFAADVEPDMVVYLRERADSEGLTNVIPVLCSYDDPRLPSASTDLVLFVNTWHHVGDRVDYAKRLRDDVAAGGRLVLVDYGKDEDRPHGPPPEHCLSPEEAIAELEKAGWFLSKRHDFLRWQYVLEFSTTE